MRTLFASFVALLLLAPTAFAQETNRPAGIPADARQVEHADAHEAAALAHALAAYGMRTDDPMALLSAARILVENPVTAAELEGDAGQAGEAKDDVDMDITAQGLIDAARGMTDDEGLLAVASRLEQRARQAGVRGLVGGPARVTGIVNAHSSTEWFGTYRGGETARIALVGDGDTDLDIYVYDENGYLITSGTGYTDREVVAWTPRWSGRFRIVVRNLGGVWNRYVLLSN